jgi:hypothetical protein
MNDHDEIQALLAAFLAAVTFEAGGTPEYGRIRELFVPGGMLIRNSGAEPDIASVEEFIAPRQASFDAGELTDFEETEISGVTELFGNVAHRFSAYGKRGTIHGAGFEARGMIATQFVRTPAGWRMSAMAWDDEREGLAVPDRFL